MSVRLAATAAALLLLSAFVLARPTRAQDAVAETESRVRAAATATYVHGMTAGIARETVGPEGLPALRRLLHDPDFPRRDNVVAYLAYLGDDGDTPALLDLLYRPPAGHDRPVELRAAIVAMEALGRIAGRGGDAARAALLDVVGDRSAGGAVEEARRAGTVSPHLADALLAAAVRALAVGGDPALEARLDALAAGRARGDVPGFDFGAAARAHRLAPAPAPAPASGGGLAPAPVSRADDTSTGCDETSLTYANHFVTGNPMSDNRLDAALEAANLVAGREDDSADVACCIRLVRSGTAGSWAISGQDSIDTSGELDSVLANPVARVKVVNAIGYCSGPGTNIIGCAERAGFGMAVVRLPNLTVEGLLWMHEYGHNAGLLHNPNPDQYIMSPSLGGSNLRLNQQECNAFHTPSPNALASIADCGGCDDADDDGFVTPADNCPAVSNPNQADQDSDGFGNPCDPCPGDSVNDPDLDALCATDDNCPLDSNPDQSDEDGDTIGDVCDPCPQSNLNDLDGDGTCEVVDNCPYLANPDQADQDADGIGDACDRCPLGNIDEDLDALPCDADPCPGDPMNDADGDGACTAADACPSLPGFEGAPYRRVGSSGTDLRHDPYGIDRVYVVSESRLHRYDPSTRTSREIGSTDVGSVQEVLTAQDGETLVVQALLSGGASGLFRVPATGGPLTSITGFEPGAGTVSEVRRISETRIGFRCDCRTSVRELFVSDLVAGTVDRRSHDYESGENLLSWAVADGGDRLVYLTQGPAGFRLWSVPPTGAAASLIGPTPEVSYVLFWNAWPETDRILIQMGVRLFSLPATGGTAIRINDVDISTVEREFLRGGNSVLYRASGGPGTKELWRVPIEGGLNERLHGPIPEGGTGLQWLSVAPDGASVAFSGDFVVAGQERLYIAEATGPAVELTDEWVSTAWSENGEWFAWVAEGGPVRVVPRSGAPVHVASGTVEVDDDPFVTIAATGGGVWFRADDGVELRLGSIDGGEPVELPFDAEELRPGAAGRALYFRDGDEWYEAPQYPASDDDEDGIPGSCDCAPGDPDTWSPPGAIELEAYEVGDDILLTWTAPADTGNASGQVEYRVLSSSAAGNWSGAACAATTAATTELLSGAMSLPGDAFYLVRAANACGTVTESTRTAVIPDGVCP